MTIFFRGILITNIAYYRPIKAFVVVAEEKETVNFHIRETWYVVCCTIHE